LNSIFIYYLQDWPLKKQYLNFGIIKYNYLIFKLNCILFCKTNLESLCFHLLQAAGILTNLLHAIEIELILLTIIITDLFVDIIEFFKNIFYCISLFARKILFYRLHSRLVNYIIYY
jgi:hypothetical protein